MAGKKLKRDQIQFMNGKYDDFWSNVHVGSLMLACIGICATALSEVIRMGQVDSYVGKNQEAKDAINNTADKFNNVVK